MLEIALLLFILGALGGLFMALQILGGKAPTPAVAVLHGLANGSALALLIIAALNRNLPAAVGTALTLFILAAAGGLFLASRHLARRDHPRPVVILHGAVAVAGIVALIIAVF